MLIQVHPNVQEIGDRIALDQMEGGTLSTVMDVLRLHVFIPDVFAAVNCNDFTQLEMELEAQAENVYVAMFEE